jgi:CheY-like chemotaxis protein
MKTVLVIEDNAIYRLYVCSTLEMQGFQVIEADNGFNGLGLAIELQADVIVCDVELPKTGGFKVLQAIRKHSTTAKIPFIFLTADSDLKSRDRALALGANAYLNKIIETQTLTQIILEQIECHRSTSQWWKN